MNFPQYAKRNLAMHHYLKERQYLLLLHKYWVLVWNDDVWRNAKKWEQTNANLKYVLHCCIPYAYFQLLMPIDSIHNKSCLACLRQDYMNITASLNWSIFSHASNLHFTGSYKYLYPKRHITSISPWSKGRVDLADVMVSILKLSEYLLKANSFLLSWKVWPSQLRFLSYWKFELSESAWLKWADIY